MNDKHHFDKLRKMAEEIHPYTWCVKQIKTIPTSHLIANECLNCEDYILNKGICDPL